MEKKKRPYKYNSKQKREGSLSHVLMDTLVQQNPFYFKYIIDSVLDAQKRWIEIETQKEVLANINGYEYIPRPCPITPDVIRWLSKYFRFLNLEKNGDLNTDCVSDGFGATDNPFIPKTN